MGEYQRGNAVFCRLAREYVNDTEQQETGREQRGSHVDTVQVEGIAKAEALCKRDFGVSGKQQEGQSGRVRMRGTIPHYFSQGKSDQTYLHLNIKFRSCRNSFFFF